MIYNFILVMHVIVCILLIAIVLLQVGKGAGLGNMFGGGGSDSLLSGTGGNVLLKKITAGCAIMFMFTSLTLSVLSAKRKVRSVMDIMPPAPVIPKAPGEAARQQAEKPPVTSEQQKTAANK